MPTEVTGVRRRVHTVSFDTPRKTLAAVRRFRADGFDVHDVHTPFPIHGMDEALELPETRLGFATLAGGLLGLATALALQGYTHVLSWPLHIGGKSMLAMPALVPVSFELTVLFAAFATVGALFARRRLFPRLLEPISLPSPTVTDDRFVVVILESDAGFSIARFRETCRSLEPAELVEGWRVL